MKSTEQLVLTREQLVENTKLTENDCRLKSTEALLIQKYKQNLNKIKQWHYKNIETRE